MERVDRQVRVIGKKAQQKLSTSSVLIVGLGGLGVECAKNLILTGFKKVGIFDRKIVDNFDLGTQFFCKEENVGKRTRVEASIEELQSLNSFCTVVNESRKRTILTTPLLKLYDVVIFTENHLTDLVSLNSFCRSENIQFLACESRGVFGTIFTDFGDSFVCFDQTGEKEAQGIVSGLSVGGNGLLLIDTKNEQDRSVANLSKGDVVRVFDCLFKEIDGKELDIVERVGTHKYVLSLKVGDDLGKRLEAYRSGGKFVQVKKEVKLKFLSLEDSLKKIDENVMTYDFSKMDAPKQVLHSFKAMWEFSSRHSRLPKSFNIEDSKEMIQIAKDLVAGQQVDESIFNEDFVKYLSFTCRGNLNPMTTLLGGLVSQEAQKAVTGKFHPIMQWFAFECVDCINIINEEKDYAPLNCRYDSQIAVFGRKFQKQLGDLKYFLVGTGALGCEFLKNYALMGICCGPKGKLSIVDMDAIEVSNLSRQFLFREEHVGQMKAECAQKAAVKMNPSIFIKTFTDPVGPSTEDVFHYYFWYFRNRFLNFRNELDGIMNALDNINGRRYVDSKAVGHLKPLFESGTLGAKAHTQCIIPHLTINFSAQKDPKSDEFPECTIHVFPSVIQHTISWAKRLFLEKFNASVKDIKVFLLDRKEFLVKNATNFNTLRSMHEILISRYCPIGGIPKSFQECLIIARNMFEYYFVHDILNILLLHPIDEKTKSGGLFWSGSKVCPRPIKFSLEDEEHFSFVLLFAKFLGRIFGILNDSSSLPLLGEISKIIKEAKIVEYIPSRKDVKKKALRPGEQTLKSGKLSSKKIERLQKMKERLLKFNPLKIPNFEIIELEKNDTNHIAFITAASNIRAKCYNIPPLDQHETKGVVGSITPAMITTTALTTGLIMFEVYKYHQNVRDIEKYSNGFLNIALPMFLLSRPLPPKCIIGSHTVWDRVIIKRKNDITLGEFVSFLEGTYNVNIIKLYYHRALVFSTGDTIPLMQLQFRLDSELRRLTEIIIMKRIPPSQNEIVYGMVIEKKGVIYEKFIPVTYIVENIE